MSRSSASRSTPASPTGPGARFGPRHIRAASKLLRTYHPRLDVEPFAVHQVADAGDIAVNPFDIAEAITTIERGLRRAARRRHQADHPRRRPHHRAAAAAFAAPRPRPDLGAALRRSPGHLGHLLRRAVHPRHPVPPGQRRRPARPRALPARRHPRSVVRAERPLRRPCARLPGDRLRRLPDRRTGHGHRADARAPR